MTQRTDQEPQSPFTGLLICVKVHDLVGGRRSLWSYYHTICEKIVSSLVFKISIAFQQFYELTTSEVVQQITSKAYKQ